MAQADEDALPGPGPAVRIRVAIQEAEDAAEPQDDAGAGLRGAEDPARYLSPGWGSASEDEPSRGLSAPSSENERDELEQEWKPPDQELIRKLVEQIEFYFSDENLEKDAFLLKHVRRNKLGYVSVKLLTSFKKVKHLTRDWRITAHALRYSGTLELNEDQRKVRRTTPVPLFPNENLPSKMLLLYDLYLSPALWALAAPQNGRLQERVMEHLLQQFGTFGGIASVRILRPGRELPPDIRRLGGRYSQVGTQDCAIVEFEEVEAAVRAHEFMVAESQGKDSMKAVLIGLKPPKKKPARDRPQDEEPAASVRLCKSPHRRVEELQYLGDESSANSSSEPESDPTSPMAGRRLALCNKLAPNAGTHCLFLSPSTSPCSSPWSSPLAQRKGVPRKSPLAGEGIPEAPCKCTDYSSDSSVTPSSSPWVRRRRQAELGTPEKSPRASPLLARKVQTVDRLPVGVLRWPRGPDDTRGFHGGHERNRAHV